ncbi:DUF2752 domain-containing protein [Dactylosporangium sp. CA-152071]|uniref:DUF2752 domain-containing protein n=2 Tax=Micromonosporaceae TaxID=28056 RepID=UPI003CD0A835
MTSPLQAVPASDGMAAHLLPGGSAADVVQPGAGGHEVPPYGYQYAYVTPPKGRLARLAERTPRWVSPLGLTALVSGGVAYTLLMRPTQAGATDAPTCVMKLFTGFDCPGCGGTRAAWYLLHGDIPAAAHHHAMLVFAAPFLAYMYASWTINRLANRKVLPMMQLSSGTLIGFLVAWLIFSVVRNLPWAPFDWLFV